MLRSQVLTEPIPKEDAANRGSAICLAVAQARNEVHLVDQCPEQLAAESGPVLQMLLKVRGGCPLGTVILDWVPNENR